MIKNLLKIQTFRLAFYMCPVRQGARAANHAALLTHLVLIVFPSTNGGSAQHLPMAERTRRSMRCVWGRGWMCQEHQMKHWWNPGNACVFLVVWIVNHSKACWCFNYMYVTICVCACGFFYKYGKWRRDFGLILLLLLLLLLARKESTLAKQYIYLFF